MTLPIDPKKITAVGQQPLAPQSPTITYYQSLLAHFRFVLVENPLQTWKLQCLFKCMPNLARIPSSAKVNQQNQKMLWLPLPVIKKISLVLHNFIFVMPIAFPAIAISSCIQLKGGYFLCFLDFFELAFRFNQILCVCANI